jgi:hypothetical protein
VTTFQSEGSQMSQGFKSSLNDLCEFCGVNPDTIDNDSVLERWSKFVCEEYEGVRVSVLVNKGDVCVLERIQEIFPELNIKSVEPTDKVWDHLKSLNTFAVVDGQMPSNMMSRIESLATKLTDDIVNGKPLSDLNMDQIGNEILSSCDQEDMNKFVQNMDVLLPALQSSLQGKNPLS